MSFIVSALIMILILGVLIITHELGHFWAARKRGVGVTEFAIGMGPVILKREKTLPDGSPGTKYTLRALPIGGFCLMEGEDADSESPTAFNNASRLSRFLILVAGSAMNIVLGVVLCFLFVLPINYTREHSVSVVEQNSALAAYMQEGDEFISINGHRILFYQNIPMFLELGQSRPSYDLVIQRDGQRINYSGITIDKRDFNDGNGARFGFACAEYHKNTFGDKMGYAVRYAADSCRLVWISLGELIFGSAGLGDLMGPVGMGGAVNTIVTDEESNTFGRIWGLLSMGILISLNLAVVNLLPIPALDGGRIVFLLIETIRRKPVPPKVEGTIHGAAMLCLFALMAIVMFNDIVRLIGGGGP